MLCSKFNIIFRLFVTLIYKTAKQIKTCYSWETHLSEELMLTLSERMPPYSRHHKYSKKIECRHTGGKKKKFPTFAGIKTQKLPFSQNYNSKIAEFYKNISNFV